MNQVYVVPPRGVVYPFPQAAKITGVPKSFIESAVRTPNVVHISDLEGRLVPVDLHRGLHSNGNGSKKVHGSHIPFVALLHYEETGIETDRTRGYRNRLFGEENDAQYVDSNACKEMFAAVIENAIRDIEILTKYEERTSLGKNERARRKAILDCGGPHVFFASTYFEDICDILGLSPGAVRKEIEARLLSPRDSIMGKTTS